MATGGEATKAKWIKIYEENPKYCLNCGTKLEFEKRKNKFCNCSCSATYNNKLRPRKIKPNLNCKKVQYTTKSSSCLNCGKILNNYQSFYCNNKCQQEHKYKERVIKWQSGEEIVKPTPWGALPKFIRRYIFQKYNSKCCICGWGETNPFTNTIPLEVDHIDGDYNNNIESNLRLICPNCHSLTETYRGANRGKGRHITWIKTK